jgi:hypothetical protein
VGTQYLNIGYINYVNSPVFLVETVYCEVGTQYLNIGYIKFVFRGRVMGQDAAGLSPRRAGVNPRLVYVTSVVDKVALRRVSLRIVRLFPGIFQQCTALIFTSSEGQAGQAWENFEKSNDDWDTAVHWKGKIIFTVWQQYSVHMTVQLLNIIQQYWCSDKREAPYSHLGR